MKRFCVIAIVLLFTAAYAQKSNEKTEGGKESAEKKVNTAIPNGYENIQWGTLLSEAKGKILGKLVFSDDKSIIISREGELVYHYGFLYIDPALESAESAGEAEKGAPAVAGPEKKEAKPGSEKADEGKLFYVALKFPYLSMEEVKKKIEEKYGPSTNENLNKMQGAVAWNGENTIIIMWVDRYEDRPYCCRITYVDKRVTKELSGYQFRVFNRVELAVLKKLGF